MRKGKLLGQEFELDPAAQALRSAAKEEILGPEPADDAAVDRAAVLESTAAVLEARTEDERDARLQDLRRTVVSPIQRLRLATDWVMNLEREYGREPKPTEDGPADLASGSRLIDIKAIRSRGLPYIRFTNNDLDRIRQWPQFFIYLVLMDDHDDPTSWTIKVLNQQRLLDAVQSGRFFYEIPSRALIASAPGLEALEDHS